jgi:hypothetical protein
MFRPDPWSLHFGSGSFVPGFPIRHRPTRRTSTNLVWTTVDLLFSGKLQKFPDLQFSLSEGGIG